MPERSDEELMLAFANNDMNAFELLYARYKDALYRYFLRHLSDQNIVQELVQDLWMKVIHSKSNYQVTAKFSTWLYTLAHNRLVDWYRRNNLESKAFKENTDESVDATIEWNPADELQTKRLAKALKKGINTLPFNQRELFLLHQEACLTLPQIAEMLDEGIEKIKSRYRYALQKLRNQLENER
jgi:RNA polymerase sigma-70 factor (ECF subfamily)